MKKLLRKAAILAVATFALATGTAQAGMIPTLVTVTPDGGNFRWTYAVVVTTDVQVNTGDYFTIYDFGGMIDPMSIATPLGWNVSTAMTGPTPPGTGPNDDAGIVNATFTYTGDPIAGQKGLGNFMLQSLYGEATSSEFTSITHRQVDGQAEANITSTDVPVPGQGGGGDAPEPATAALFGISLPLLGLARYLRNRRQKA